jgi:ZIP family zinc transporter
MDFILLVILITVAGPLIGSLLGVLRKPSEAFLLNMLAFAAGVMLAVSFLELIPGSIEASSAIIASAGILIGSLVMFGIDKLIPHIHPGLCKEEQGCRIRKTALFLFAGIFIHNLPEGMAIATGLVEGLSLSLTIAIAIAIHDIPEAICTSSPYYFCTGKRLRAFLLSSSTALPTIVGFLAAYYLFSLMPLWLLGLITAATACGKGFSHSTIFSLIAGVLLVMLLGYIGI